MFTGYMLRIDCWEAEKDLKITPGSDCVLDALAIDEPLEYARLYLDVKDTPAITGMSNTENPVLMVSLIIL